jgi:lipopolysaccharide transport system ATP-binding protein
MKDSAISIENISKQYRLGLTGTGTLGHDLKRWWYNVRGKEDPYLKIGESNDRTAKGESNYVWSLRDINFDIKEGDAVGIIGRNGAGKSTLLKILSKVTSPTTGQIKIKGRIASLLEVGTGFHPELTGRENVFMNGAIMGMRKDEIRAKFDEIVAFSGVERYIDTPVKRYSSGMYVRLAFAVAAHLEPEILIVDEVLAVGDTEFQRKCLGKMQDVSGQGRTVLFVSHDLQAISTLTNSCCLLKNGELAYKGDTASTIDAYLSSMISSPKVYEDNTPVLEPKITKVEVQTSEINNVHAFGESLKVNFIINTPRPLKGAALSFQIYNTKEQAILHLLTLDSEQAMCRKLGEYEIVCEIPKLRLYPGNYVLKVHFAEQGTKTKFQTIEGICPFEVVVLGEIRDYYWYPNHATYVEEHVWYIKGQ